MKRLILGILLGVTVLCHPIRTEAYERQCPKPIEIDYQDAQLLMQVASNEALNQGESGMSLVMSVVLNRVESPDFPNTIREVIFQTGQFYTKNITNAEITPEVHMALASIECGNKYPQIIAFEKSNNDALDKYFSEAFTYGAHKFYTQKIN